MRIQISCLGDVRRIAVRTDGDGVVVDAGQQGQLIIQSCDKDWTEMVITQLFIELGKHVEVCQVERLLADKKRKNYGRR